jgi:hypothetical protein
LRPASAGVELLLFIPRDKASGWERRSASRDRQDRLPVRGWPGLDRRRQHQAAVQTPALQVHPRHIGIRNKILHSCLQFGRMVACGES